MKDSQYSKDEIIKMRTSGKSKPDDITWSAWHQVIELKPQHEAICWMIATGMTNKRVAEETGLSAVRISQLKGSESVQIRIKEIQHKVFGNDAQKRFGALTHEAIDTVAQIMNNSNEKGSTRLRASQEVLDRSIGRPVQQVEHRDTNLSDLYNRLDELGTRLPGILAKKEDVEDVEFKELIESDIALKDKEDPCLNQIELTDELANVDRALEGIYGSGQKKKEPEESWDF